MKTQFNIFNPNIELWYNASGLMIPNITSTIVIADNIKNTIHIFFVFDLAEFLFILHRHAQSPFLNFINSFFSTTMGKERPVSNIFFLFAFIYLTTDELFFSVPYAMQTLKHSYLYRQILLIYWSYFYFVHLFWQEWRTWAMKISAWSVKKNLLENLA